MRAQAGLTSQRIHSRYVVRRTPVPQSGGAIAHTHFSARFRDDLTRHAFADAPPRRFMPAVDASQRQPARLEVQNRGVARHHADETSIHRVYPTDEDSELVRVLPIHGRRHPQDAFCKPGAVYRGRMPAARRPTGNRSSKGNLPDVSIAIASSAYCPRRSESTMSRIGRSMCVKNAL